MLVQITNVGVAAQKPEQLVNDRLEMQLLRCQQRKTFTQIEPRLRAENGDRSRAGAIDARGCRDRARGEEDRDIGALLHFGDKAR